jgi:hypothetical protein
MKYLIYLFVLIFTLCFSTFSIKSSKIKQINREPNPSSNPLPNKWINGPANSFSVLHTNKKHNLNHVNMIVQNTYKDNTAAFTKERLEKKLKNKSK